MKLCLICPLSQPWHTVRLKWGGVAEPRSVTKCSSRTLRRWFAAFPHPACHSWHTHACVCTRLHLTASGSRCPATGCSRHPQHNALFPEGPWRSQPRTSCHRFGTGAVSKSKGVLLHRIPLVTSFRFTQAHSVGHFHSFRKNRSPSLPASAKRSYIGWKNSKHLHFISHRTKQMLKREKQVGAFLLILWLSANRFFFLFVCIFSEAPPQRCHLSFLFKPLTKSIHRSKA